ncbi:MAG TPA: hypothetical protein VGK74_18165 [Symbiobacteriaceae bacterium]|jgi:cation transport ATPase
MGITEWLGYPAHLLPGRLRVCLPGLRHNRALAARFAALLDRRHGVGRFAVNLDTGSLLVRYDPDILTPEAIADLLGLRPRATRTPAPVQPGPFGAASPAGSQARQTVLTGVAMLAVMLKRFLAGPSALSRSWRLYDLNGVLTVAASYPFLRRGLLSLVKRGRLNGDLLIGTAGLALSFLRESIPGLAVIFLANLTELVFARTAAECRTCVDGFPGPAAVLPTKACEPPEAPTAPEGWGWVGVPAVAGVAAGLLTGDWRRALAALIASAPAAATQAGTLPLAASTVAAARAGVLVQGPAAVAAAGDVAAGRRTAVLAADPGDLPALAGAGLRLVLSRGATAELLQAADAVILGDGPREAAAFIRLGSRALQVARQNQALVAGLNTAGLALAATGVIGPLGATLWHNVTSLAVLANSSRLIPR